MKGLWAKTKVIISKVIKKLIFKIPQANKKTDKNQLSASNIPEYIKMHKAQWTITMPFLNI